MILLLEGLILFEEFFELSVIEVGVILRVRFNLTEVITFLLRLRLNLLLLLTSAGVFALRVGGDDRFFDK